MRTTVYIVNSQITIYLKTSKYSAVNENGCLILTLEYDGWTKFKTWVAMNCNTNTNKLTVGVPVCLIHEKLYIDEKLLSR